MTVKGFIPVIGLFSHNGQYEAAILKNWWLQKGDVTEKGENQTCGLPSYTGERGVFQLLGLCTNVSP